MLYALFACLSFTACKKDAWNEHNAPVTQALDKTLFEQISTDANLSVFTSLLIKTGYDKVLQSSKAFTVWAPANAALQNLDPAIIEDEVQLKLYVGNHISNQSYFTTMPDPLIVIKMLNGKNTTFTTTQFEDAKITTANVYVKNGVLHTIDQDASPRPNAWELLQNSTVANTHKSFIEGLEHTELDTTNGVLLFVDPVTKKGVYQEGTTFEVQKNTYFQKIADISSEDSLITYIILNDAAFLAERAKLAAFHEFPDALTADTLLNWSVVRDLVINQVYTIDELPDSMTSVTGVKIHLDKSSIVETHKLSNGIAYVVNSIGYQVLENKIPTIIIEGEYLDSLRTPSNPIYRVKKDTAGVRFTDIQTGSITSSPDPLYYFRYKSTAYSTKYEVWIRAVNDILNTSISVKVDFSPTRRYPKMADIPQLATMGYTELPSILGLDLEEEEDAEKYRTAFKEVKLGTYSPEYYGDLYTFLVSSLGATSALPTALSLDYIKLKPVN